MSQARIAFFLALLLALAATQLPCAHALTLASSAFGEAAGIPVEHGCASSDRSPPLAWSDPPPGTESFALIVEDLDAAKSPTGSAPQWVVYDIPTTRHALDAGVPGTERLADGTKQGVTAGGKLGYQGPCPPAGESHRYRFQVFALDVLSEVAPGASSSDLRSAMRGHVLAEASLTASFGR